MQAESSFRAMGSDCHVVVVGDESLLSCAQIRIEQLEAMWSRFRPTSEISRMNRIPGCPALVSEETFGLIEHAVAGARATEGRFDPMLLSDLVTAGYDRSFALLERDRPARSRTRAPHGLPTIDRVSGCITVPDGGGFDPGGIGKGFAADLVYSELRRAGARGACVNIGGDLRCGGSSPDANGWIVGIEHPLTGAIAMSVEMARGAVATSARTKRTWLVDGRPAHHLIDPRSGRPSSSSLAAVTVFAREAWWAEVWAKAAFMDGPRRGRALLEMNGLNGVLIDHDGTLRSTADLEERAS